MPRDVNIFHSAAEAGVTPYLPGLDGLRAVAILLVVVSHLGAPWGVDRVVPGAFGVTLFFFISGYLITRQLAASLAAGGGGGVDLARFYARRALRLMPAGLAYVALAGVAFVLAGGQISAGGWAAAVLYGANYHDLWWGFRSALAGVRHPFNILWSLAIEEHFYALWPLSLGWLRPPRAVVALVVLCGAVLAWRLYLWGACFAPAAGSGAMGVCGPANPNPVWRYNRLYLATDTRLDSIAWGALLALLPAWRARPLVGVALLVVGFALPGAVGRYVLRPSLQGAGLLALFPALLADGPGAGWLRRPACVLAGRLSYSLYLWHWAALGVADWAAPAGSVAWLGIAVALGTGLAAASYWGIERPMLRLRHRFGSHAAG